ncbi:MAG: undecaprenyl-phosphate glucose phosphotransferase [Pseudomonas sp.]
MSSHNKESLLQRPSERVAAFGIWLRFADILAVVAAAALSYALRFGVKVPTMEYRVAIGTTILYALLCFLVSPLYRGWRGRSFARELGVLLLVWTIVFALFSMHALLVKMGTAVSRQWLAYWYGSGYVAMVFARVGVRVARHRLRSQGVYMQRVVVVGLRTPVLKLHRYLRAHPGVGIDIVGYFASSYDIRTSSDSAAPTRLGDLEGLQDYLRENQHRVEQVWISLPLTDRGNIKGLLRMLERYPVPVQLVPDVYDFGTLNLSVSQIGSVPMIGLRQGLTQSNFLIIKRIEDSLVAGIAVLLLSPLYLLLAIGVKLSSPGPVFFRQSRNGLGGKEFKMLKFRSMRVHQEHSGQVTQATRDDPRVTPFGAFLRRTSLDELPQFFNVLGGSMSVVGPRPHAVAHTNQYERRIQRYMQRHYVKPGITGWAQVHGFRGETRELRDMKKRVQYDIDYIRRWTPWLDIKIIVMTALKVLGQKTAY